MSEEEITEEELQAQIDALFSGGQLYRGERSQSPRALYYRVRYLCYWHLWPEWREMRRQASRDFRRRQNGQD